MPRRGDRRLRDRLHDPNRWLRWRSYESLLDTLSQHQEVNDWASTFRTRYLDFAPVTPLLAPEDLRQQTRQPLHHRGAIEARQWHLPNGCWLLPNGIDGPMFLAPPDLISVREISATTIMVRFEYGSGKAWEATFRRADLTQPTSIGGFVKALDTDLLINTTDVPDHHPEAY